MIAGPCSAETREQVLATARAIASIPQCRVFRAGIWKPRTRPQAFQGMGASALQWVREAGKETGLLTAVEVARPQHVEEAVEAGIDILWIGARTVGNPFSVQEIADSLRGADIPVMVKNPLIPDINLWIGAMERLDKMGLTRLAAVHRGFFTYHNAGYRHDPMWEIPIELKRYCPAIPIICDPSHITGKPELLQSVSQRALDLAMEGLMIETHINPAAALSDARQQISPAQLEALLATLVVRTPGTGRDFEDLLQGLRQEIDRMDQELIQVLSRRMNIVRRIGAYKKEYGITALQIRRWASIIEDRLEKGESAGLHREFLLRLLQIVHKEAIRIQSEELGQTDDSPGKDQ